VIDIVIFVGVLYKKDELRNSFKNTSFSKISNWILNMVGVNMMIGAIISTFIFEELIAIFNFCNNYNSGRSCDESAQKYNDIMDNMYTLFIMLVRIISITQIYEWFVMRMILLWQHKKDLR
jgi:O-antigen/teichoic acid export membrane protein